MEHQTFSVTLRREDGYKFSADFGEAVAPVTLDELPPIGRGEGPDPARLLAAAVAHCLGASLLYCLQRQHIDVGDVKATVEGRMVRNERGRLRIGGFRVTLEPTVDPELWERMGRCLDLFEDFCVVTESVRKGIPVEVTVEPLEAVPALATAGELC
jgi:uncharacterized OsmC-like protein